MEDLAKQCELASRGDLKRSEAMLTAQTHTLDALFNSLARRAALNMGEYLNAAEIYMRLALKTQSQCRASIETLAVIKHPQPVAFVRQTNIANGPQQVNNTPATSGEPSRARESESRPNELLELQRSERLDGGAPKTTVGSDLELAPVGAIDRTAEHRR